MDRLTYLKNKEEQKLKDLQFKKESFCYTCFRLDNNCLCHLIKPFATKIHFVLLIHPMEAKKEKLGTGRLTRATLKNSQMIMGVDFTQNDEVNQLISDPGNECMVLYPGERAINISSDDISILKSTIARRLVLFVIDGTWPCAKKMMKLSSNINTLPRISFTSNRKSEFIIKEQPADFCLSTIESIHFFLDEAKRRGLENLESEHDNMIEVFKAMVEFQLKCATDPNLPSYRHRKTGYTTASERTKSKKWGSRRIIHRD